MKGVEYLKLINPVYASEFEIKQRIQQSDRIVEAESKLRRAKELEQKYRSYERIYGKRRSGIQK